MAPVGDHAVVVVWQQEKLTPPSRFAQYSNPGGSEQVNDLWSAMRESLEEARPELDPAAAAALSGPIGFDLNAAAGGSMLLPHLAGLKHLMEMFGWRAMLALHNRDENTAWTNLLAATRLVTAWRTEPVEISQRVRWGNLNTVYDFTWQALQAGDWPDDRLVQLQREWDSCDLFKGLPDAIAFTGAGSVALCRQERQMPPVARLMVSPRSPGQTIGSLTRYFQEMSYRHHGTYVDENDMLLFYHDRVVEARNAIQFQSWAEMRRLPGVTNDVFFTSRYKHHFSRAQTAMRLRHLSTGLFGTPVGLIGSAAEAEARRRVVVAAIALKRFHVRHGAYPKSLADLAPEFVKAAPIDFMDGQPLRYSLADDGHFLLYSVGLDCVDDGGKMPPGRDGRFAMLQSMRGGGAPVQSDIVWPLPATATAAKAHADEEARQASMEKAAEQQRQAAWEAQREADRQAEIQELLTNPGYKKAICYGAGPDAKEPTYGGQPLSRFFCNAKSFGSNAMTLDAMLTLNPVATGGETEVITYQVPVAYDVLKSISTAHLGLSVDSPPGEALEGRLELEDCKRATNGDCLLSRNMAYERPGSHALQAYLTVQTTPAGDGELLVKGAVLSFWSSNLFRFDPDTMYFEDDRAALFARLPESNATYSIEIKTPGGEHVRTVTGTTTNAVIRAVWDLVDEQGKKYTSNSFVGYFHVMLPDSGRSQTLKQIQNK
jgi:hypothetical protein